MGKAVAQLACNNGCELLSIKNMGAGRCVGFDIAEEFVRQAQELNAAAGQDCEFVASNVYEIPADYHAQFDLVFISIGVLSWMPDIHAFFGVVARLLRPGGHLLIYEMHPVTTMLDLPEKSEHPLQIALSYFNTKATEENDGLDYYQNSEYDALPNYWFTHTLGAILNGAIANGIAIVSLDEYPHDISAIFGPLEQYGLLPLSYILVGQKKE
jgi:ubiquinone/menaquinone biosynthesis C-methylase UbiE